MPEDETHPRSAPPHVRGSDSRMAQLLSLRTRAAEEASELERERTRCDELTAQLDSNQNLAKTVATNQALAADDDRRLETEFWSNREANDQSPRAMAEAEDEHAHALQRRSESEAQRAERLSILAQNRAMLEQACVERSEKIARLERAHQQTLRTIAELESYVEE
jgi:hypothetical protein